jgi:two-component system response regulator QseB
MLGRGDAPTTGALSGSVMDQNAVVEIQRERVELPRVLLVEDERQLGEMLARLLEAEGFAVDLATDGQAALHLGLTRQHQLLLIDRGLPAIEGLDLLGRLRSRGVTGRALVLTARGSVADRVAGLDAGADDYLTKPFAVEELLARLRALLRRHEDSASGLGLGDRFLDLGSRTVEGGQGEPVELTEREAALLGTLARRPGRIFSREELLDLVFEGADGPAVVDTYVHYLRRKLGRGAVRTVRGIGYRMGSV